MQGLRFAMDTVQRVRDLNEDVFKWPSMEWSALYTIEEITELMRWVQRKQYPDHLRRDEADPANSISLEWGQALMMLLTLGIQLGVDPNVALDQALEKIETRSQARREATKPPAQTVGAQGLDVRRMR